MTPASPHMHADEAWTTPIPTVRSASATAAAAASPSMPVYGGAVPVGSPHVTAARPMYASTARMGPADMQQSPLPSMVPLRSVPMQSQGQPQSGMHVPQQGETAHQQLPAFGGGAASTPGFGSPPQMLHRSMSVPLYTPQQQPLSHPPAGAMPQYPPTLQHATSAGAAAANVNFGMVRSPSMPARSPQPGEYSDSFGGPAGSVPQQSQYLAQQPQATVGQPSNVAPFQQVEPESAEEEHSGSGSGSDADPEDQLSEPEGAEELEEDAEDGSEYGSGSDGDGSDGSNASEDADDNEQDDDVDNGAALRQRHVVAPVAAPADGEVDPAALAENENEIVHDGVPDDVPLEERIKARPFLHRVRTRWRQLDGPERSMPLLRLVAVCLLHSVCHDRS